MTAEELDARIRTLPPAFGIRHFAKGITPLAQISGPERKAMARILLGCLVGRIPAKGITACRDILDFIYLAQYTTHDDGTLACLKEALDVWHENREFFILAGVRTDFNIPKFHSLIHYIDFIRFFGTTDNYNTEMFERLHIDFAKNGWRASNRRDEFPQMITWLGRQEKLLSRITENHKAPSFLPSLKEYLNQFGNHLPAAQLQAAKLPFSRLDIYHNFKFEPTSLDPAGADDGTATAESSQTVIACPAATDGTPARFDTAIAREKGTGEATGLTGMRVVRVKVLFKLPTQLDNGDPAPRSWPKDPLAYVECFSSFRPSHEPNHNMFAISKPPPRADGSLRGSVIYLSDIRQICQLFPNFGRADVNPQWTSDNVLDQCSSFLLNNWASLYSYQSMW
ncbi:hypothetical protein B0H17DRAFT_1267231 [Mycena rosella]|uniref:Uncharacterized protein n=1 Tax=Mycena rosella TaxID=1033263 RepID=A0AAD7CMR9_MYCRO|nr:hypothetical protein B0H17DRAFT_1267231 [Mycena rosella]